MSVILASYQLLNIEQPASLLQPPPPGPAGTLASRARNSRSHFAPFTFDSITRHSLYNYSFYVLTDDYYYCSQNFHYMLWVRILIGILWKYRWIFLHLAFPWLAFSCFERWLCSSVLGFEEPTNILSITVWPWVKSLEEPNLNFDF